MNASRLVTAVLGMAVTTWVVSVSGAATRVVSAQSADTLPSPPARLSETGLYAAGGRATGVAPGVEPYAPQYPLWSDGLIKRRWIAVPAGATIDAADPYNWQFPVGTKLWKEFALGDRRVETRFFWRATATAWVSGTYVWDAEGVDAVLAPPEGVRGVVEIAPGKRHDVPSRTDCAACHGPSESSRVLGVNALQLSTDRDPQALHGEPLQPGMATVATLARDGRFGTATPDWVAVPARIRTADAASRAVLGYLAANCGMCHDGSRAIAGFDASLAMRDISEHGDAVITRLLGTPTRWQAPGRPDGTTVLIRPGASSESAIFLRMKSRAPSSQMAPLGTVVRDADAVAAVARWIDVTLAPMH